MKEREKILKRFNELTHFDEPHEDMYLIDSLLAIAARRLLPVKELKRILEDAEKQLGQ